METKLKISVTGLSLFNECKLCFWLKHRKGIGRPGIPVATITNGMDRVIKEYMNRYRPHLPPFLKGKVPGKLIDKIPEQLTFEHNGITLKGRLDECIILDNGEHAPLDHKTRGFGVKEIHYAYQLQMDGYAWLLRQNGHKVGTVGFLAYYIPDFGELHEGVPFKIDVREVKVDPDRIPEMLDRIKELLEGEMPKGNEDCNFCKFVEKRNS